MMCCSKPVTMWVLTDLLLALLRKKGVGGVEVQLHGATQPTHFHLRPSSPHRLIPIKSLLPLKLFSLIKNSIW